MSPKHGSLRANRGSTMNSERLVQTLRGSRTLFRRPSDRISRIPSLRLIQSKSSAYQPASPKISPRSTEEDVLSYNEPEIEKEEGDIETDILMRYFQAMKKGANNPVA
mmetsp:Transcript_9098/g.27375  ORF Transcript_9098/g.27375 Transcript_9098/m.27375 type:complete len:108 (-) Transcript_9098:101-424(-)|eukprot:CAMPEP_0198722280 /NCGR_PEP_ID=MMETSP1475-20131203/65_1 /TAXON_ID= ORGANISM="Unidentified sp., Strain CCMP1999" /NCGR_SAMPLE_ID=MMETSP1475 /ASSEMBLY_ACC=CAM_ASM_001111 /LENGTH=107 /DNA_ID=CAMNT_0044483179 /DNA_START=36 /DNA_END=359 /DNA_ORIENTATION=-